MALAHTSGEDRITFGTVAPPRRIKVIQPALTDDKIPNKRTFFAISDVHLMSDALFHNWPVHPLDAAQGKQQYYPLRHYCRDVVNFIHKRTEYAAQHPNEAVELVIPGDFMDILNSWYADIKPGHPDKAAVSKEAVTIADNIIQANKPVFKALRRMAQLDNVRLHYITGNHDNPIFGYPDVQHTIRRALGQKAGAGQRQALGPDKLVFHREHYIPAGTRILFTHGNQFDNYNYTADLTGFPPGDRLNLHILNPMMKGITDRMREAGYSRQAAIETFRQIERIQRIRPFELIPNEFTKILERARKHPENDGKAPHQRLEKMIDDALKAGMRTPELDPVVLAVFKLILSPAWMGRMQRVMRPFNALFLARPKHNSPPGGDAASPELYLRPVFHRLLSETIISCFRKPNWVTRALFRMGGHQHSNRKQYQLARSLHAQTGCNIIVMGHTHLSQYWKVKPSSQPDGAPDLSLKQAAPQPGQTVAADERIHYLNLGNWCNHDMSPVDPDDPRAAPEWSARNSVESYSSWLKLKVTRREGANEIQGKLCSMVDLQDDETLAPTDREPSHGHLPA